MPTKTAGSTEFGGLKIGDRFTMDVPDTRRLVRLWCWLTRKPVPMLRKTFRVTTISTGGGFGSRL